MRLSLIGSGIVAIILMATNPHAANAQDKQRPLTPEHFRGVNQIICEWRPGTGNQAIPKIERTGLKVRPGLADVPYGVCPLPAPMNQQTLGQLYEIEEIVAVYPDLKLPVKLDDDQKSEDRKPTKEDLEAFEFAGSMICQWQEGKGEDAKKTIEEAALKIRPGIEGVPYAVCTWKPPLTLQQLETLTTSVAITAVAPNIKGIAEKATEGRVIEIARGTPKKEIKGNHTVLVPDDPGYKKPGLWGMENSRADQAWVNAHDSNIIVAIIDSGVQYTHPDLQLNMWNNPGEIRGDGIDNDKDGIVDDVDGIDLTTRDAADRFTGDPMDALGHGTHVAGTIGAVGCNGQGVVGVCWKVQILPIKTFNGKDDPEVSNLLFAIDFAVKKKAKVANLSLHWEIVPGFDLVKPIIEKRIAAAAKEGLILVCSAGNDHKDHDAKPQFPSGFPEDNIVSVAAININEQLAAFSNFGAKTVDIAAPGQDIFSTYLKDDYKSLDGTSMAAPHVSGALALIWGQSQYAGLGYKDVIQLIYNNGRTLPSLSGKCATGRTLDLSFLNPDSRPTAPPKIQPPVIIYCPPIRYVCPPPCRPVVYYRLRCRGGR